MSSPATIDPVRWATDLIRVEIALWERVDARLKERHQLSLAFFEALHFISRAPKDGLRVGDLAAAMHVTVGGTSKLVDRVAGAGLLARTADPHDRRASRLTLTRAGRRKLAGAIATYEDAVAAFLDPALSSGEQAQMHAYVTRILTAERERGAG